jgi:hypothetical protein
LVVSLVVAAGRLSLKAWANGLQEKKTVERLVETIGRCF